MRIRALVVIQALMVTLIFATPANALNSILPKAPNALVLTGGPSLLVPGWSLDYPDFSQAMASGTWGFELKPTASNSLGQLDSATLTLSDTSGKELGTSYDFAATNLQPSFAFSIYFSKLKLLSANLNQNLVVTVLVERSYGSTQQNANLKFSVPISTFPKRPSTVGDYLTVLTDFSKSIVPYPQDCLNTEFQYKVNDPYGEIDTINFTVLDGHGKEVVRDNEYFTESGLLTSSLNLCPSDLAGSVGPYTFNSKIVFDADTGKLQMSSSQPFLIASATAGTDSVISSMGLTCQKGTAFKMVKSSTCPSGYKSISFKSPDDVTWNKLTRTPNSVKGKNLILFGCVAQFDTNTGGSKFRAYITRAPMDYYALYGTNSIVFGSSKSLLALGEKDAFVAKLNVSGAYSYATFGNSTSVPSFVVRDFRKIGTC
jgi:hypothetical protein